MARLAREALIVGFFLLTAVLMTWPLPLHLSDAATHPGDPFVATWTIDWDAFATLHRRSLFDANEFYPDRLTLALSEHMYGIALVLSPLLAFVTPLAAHNIGVIFGFAACGYCLFALARSMTHSVAASLIGGVCYAFVGLRFHHLPHLVYIWSFWLPLLLLALLSLAAKPTVLRALALTAVLILNGLTSLTFLVFSSVVLATSVTVLTVTTETARTKKFWLLLAAATTVAALCLTPFLLPYAKVATLYDIHRDYGEVFPNSARWRDWLQPNYQNKLYGKWSAAEAYGHERTLFPGVLPAILALVGLAWARVRRERHAIVWLVVGALGARGLRGWFHSFLFAHSTAFRGIRMPTRWMMVGYVGLALLAAFGSLSILNRCAPRIRPWIATLIIAATLFELRVAPFRLFVVPMQTSPVYSWIAAAPIRGGVLELPMTQWASYDYLWRATVHHRPLINGVSSYIPPTYRRLTQLYEQTPISPAFLAELEKDNCSLIVVHQEALGQRSAAIREWLRDGVQSGRLVFIRQFDTGPRPDFVFALSAVERHAERWRVRQQVTVETFLRDDGWSSSAQPYVSVDEGPIGTFRGPITVSGWAVAPEGVRSIRLLFDAGRVAVEANRHERPDVLAILNWYPAMRLAGFSKTINAPPARVDGETDMRIELTTNSGRSITTLPFWFRWFEPMRDVPSWRRDKLARLLDVVGVHDAGERERIASGREAITDCTNNLLTDEESEGDAAFVQRVAAMLIGNAPSADLVRRNVRLLRYGVSRERVIRRVIESPEFAAANLESGTMKLP